MDPAVTRVATAIGIKDGPIFPLGPSPALRLSEEGGNMCRNCEVNRRGPFGRRASLTTKQCQDRGKGADSHVNVVQGHDGVGNVINNNKQDTAALKRPTNIS